MTLTMALRAQSAAASIIERLPSPTRPLAQPPAGSELLPILGNSGFPFLGSALSVLTDLLGWARQRYARYGPVYWFDAAGTRAVMVLGPDGIGEVLANRDKAFANHEGWEYFIGPFFERGLVLMDFGEHLHHRRIMQQAFGRERLVAYLDAMNPTIARELGQWRPDRQFTLYDNSKQLTLNIATETFIGTSPGAEADRLNTAFIDAVNGGLAIVRADIPGGAWHRGLRARTVLEDYFRTQLPAKRAGDGSDLFSVLCRAQSEEGERFSDDDVVNHMIFVAMAAHDTSTITLTMMGYFLGRYPQWQQRVREESRALGKPCIDYDDLDRLPVLDMVMKESLRMFSPVTAVPRQAIKDTEVLGRYVPAGTKVIAGLYPSQRMEPWWSNPDEFDPERFSEDRREDKSHRHAWTPFGGGVHKCIGLYFGGMEVKAILHQMLLNFSWSVPDGYEPPMTIGTGPLPVDGLPISLRRLPDESS